MASLEWRVISELIRSKDMLAVQDLGFNADHLSGEPEAAQIFEYIRSWYHNPDTYRKFPTKQSILRKWPSVTLTKGDVDKGDLRTLLKECKGLSLDAEVRSLCEYFYELVEDDPQKAIEIMQSHLARVSYESKPSAGFSIKEIAEDVREQRKGSLTGSIFGIPWPWEPLTTDTLGKNSEDFLLLYGRMKSMKTWVMLKSAMDDYLVHKRRVLIWSREMNRQKMALRSGSILGQVDYQTLKNGTLPLPLYDQAQMALDAMAKKLEANKDALAQIRDDSYEITDTADIMLVSGRGAPTNLEGMDAIVQAFNPDIVYFDSYYHLNSINSERARSEPERQRALAVDGKQKAIDWGIPVVATIQGNRDAEKTHGETLADIGWTDALAQEADLIIRLLYRKGSPPVEEEYEGYWRDLEARMGARKSSNGVATSGKMKLKISAKAKEKFKKTNGVPEKLIAKFDKLPTKERKAAELFLMMGGNREGTLEGLSIRCIPGYTWDMTRESVTTSEVKEIFGSEKPSSGGTSKAKNKDKGRVVDAIKHVGGSFSDLKET